MNPTTTVQISRDRADQLAAFKAASGSKTNNDALGRLLAYARKDGLIDDSMTSASIHGLSDGVVITLKGLDPQGFSFAEASQIAEIIRNCATLEKHDSERKLILSFMHSGTIQISRFRANAVGISAPMNEKRRSFSLDLARDLADAIDRAVERGLKMSA